MRTTANAAASNSNERPDPTWRTERIHRQSHRKPQFEATRRVRGLLFDDPHELVAVRRTNPERGITASPFPIHDFEELRSQQRSFDIPGAHYQSTLNHSGGGDAPERLRGAYISPPLFPALGEPPAIGRWLERDYFGGDALGRRIRPAGSDSTWRTIVGIAPDLVASSIDDTSPEMLFLPLAQSPARGFALLVRTGADPAGLYRTVRETVNAIDPDLPIYDTGTLSDVIADTNWYYAVLGALFASLGFAALFLASVGLYGVMAFAVGQRTRELGVRMAMGATPADVLRLIMRQGMMQTGSDWPPPSPRGWPCRI